MPGARICFFCLPVIAIGSSVGLVLSFLRVPGGSSRWWLPALASSKKTIKEPFGDGSQRAKACQAKATCGINRITDALAYRLVRRFFWKRPTLQHFRLAISRNVVGLGFLSFNFWLLFFRGRIGLIKQIEGAQPLILSLSQFPPLLRRFS